MDIATTSRDRVVPAAGRDIRAVWAEAALAAAAFAALCAVVLPVAPQAAEPDDGAYRASIVVITEGHLLTFSTPHALALARWRGHPPSARPSRWVGVCDRRSSTEEGAGYSCSGA